jgi:predicted Zn-dependent peptidase
MILNLKSQTELSGFFIAYKGSTLVETSKNYGISHLVEHLMCKSLKKFSDDFERFGICQNAYTSTTDVVFHITGLEEYVSKFRDEMVNSLSVFNISEEQFNIEKQIVIQEYKLYFQNQSYAQYLNVLRHEYYYYWSIGKLETLESLKYQDVVDYFNTYMKKPTLIINVSKDYKYLNSDITEQRIPSYKFIGDYDDIPKMENLGQFETIPISGSLFVEKDFSGLKIICMMLNGSLYSPLSNEIRVKRGLAYSLDLEVSQISDSQGMLITNLAVNPNNINSALDGYKEIFDNKNKYLTKERFDIVKDYYNASFKMDNINRYYNVDKYINSIDWDVENIINSITFDEIYNMYDQYFNFDKLTWFIETIK